jgi:hypothetical protein
MSWNNGNGNNNGYGQQQGPQGYGQQGGYQQQAPQQNYGGGYGEDETYARMNNAREQGGARFPFIDAGKHILCLASLEKFQHRTDGTSVRALFEVLQSDKHQPGSFVVKIYKLRKQPKFDSQASDSELLAQMCIALKGVKAGYPIGNDIKTLIEPAPVGRAEEQLARGTVVECVGVLTKKGNWTNLYWTTVDQTPEQIVQQRQRLEQKGIPQTSPQQQGTQGGQFQGAPHPQQMQQGYPAQQQYGQPQQQAGGQWGGQPQTFGPGAPQQMQPQQGYGQQPAAAPQQAVPPQQGAPQGGFLQQAQPQGPGPQGPQGGNGGGRW